MEERGRVKQLAGLSFKQYNTTFGTPLHLRIISVSPLLHSMYDILS
jgi:hypothetical protein